MLPNEHFGVPVAQPFQENLPGGAFGGHIHGVVDGLDEVLHGLLVVAVEQV